MPSPPEPVITFRDLVKAWTGAKHWASAHPDLVKFHYARHAAFSEAFGVSLDEPPAVAPPMPPWVADHIRELRGPAGLADGAAGWHLSVHRFALGSAEQARSVSGPFDGMLEAPSPLSAVHQRFATDVNDQVQSLRNHLDRMVLELLEAVYPDAAGRTVSYSEVYAYGFDPCLPAPDPLDYW